MVHDHQKINLDGPVLLLMGYIGTFFARVAHHLENQGVEVYKISFPLHEFGFPIHQRLHYSGPMSQFRSFLANEIQRLGIRHVLMVTQIQIPHQIAIDLCNDLRKQGYKIESHIFDLGYLRPNYITHEKNGVNHLSALNQSELFYRALPKSHSIIQSNYKSGLRHRKLWKGITYINHAFTNYKIINGRHKIQPRPSYLWFAILGFLRKYKYIYTEIDIRKQIASNIPFYLGVLQVATDNQITLGSRFSSVEEFITEMVESFAQFAPKHKRLFIKHHPRDRGYNNYSAHIRSLVKFYGLHGRVFYFHDAPMSTILHRYNCCGVVLINSTVGYQTLFHSVPLKALGVAPYNIEGLADQQPLDGFWAKPKKADRGLFLRFYNHVVSTTQIEGDFDGNFPFKEFFKLSDSYRSSLSPVKSQPNAFQIPLRLCWLAQALLISGITSITGFNKLSWRSKASQSALKGLGIKVSLNPSEIVCSNPNHLHVLHSNDWTVHLAKHAFFSSTGMFCSINSEAPGDHQVRSLRAQIDDAGLNSHHEVVVVPWQLELKYVSQRERWLHRNSPWRWYLSRLWGPQLLLKCKKGNPSTRPVLSAPKELSESRY